MYLCRLMATLLPFFLQCMSGAGFPDALQKNDTMPLSATFWSFGASVIRGASTKHRKYTVKCCHSDSLPFTLCQIDRWQTITLLPIHWFNLRCKFRVCIFGRRFGLFSLNGLFCAFKIEGRIENCHDFFPKIVLFYMKAYKETCKKVTNEVTTMTSGSPCFPH